MHIKSTDRFKVMYEAGLLAKERRGTWIYYRLVPDRLAALKNVFL